MSASLRLQLGGMRLSALQKRAAEAGVSADEVEKAEDGTNPKQALIDLIIGATPGPTQAQDLEAQKEILRAELKGLRLSELHKRATGVGVEEAEIEKAEDGEVLSLLHGGLNLNSN